MDSILWRQIIRKKILPSMLLYKGNMTKLWHYVEQLKLVKNNYLQKNIEKS